MGYNGEYFNASTGTLNLRTRYTYDDAGNIKESINGSRKTVYEYDKLGRVVQVTLPDHSKQTYAYDAVGNVALQTDAMGNATQYEYDALSQIQKIQYANKSSVRNEYDLNGNVVRATDAMEAQTLYEYDELNRMTQVTDALENSTQYEYDNMDNLSKVQDANGSITQYEYDNEGNLAREIDAEGNSIGYAYTKEGWLKEITKADGTKTTYSYDAVGQLTRENYADDTRITHEYNSVGMITVMQNDAGKTSYQYDDKGQLISVTNSKGDVVKYTYDNMGRKASITYPDDKTVGYEYDEMDRLKKVTGLDGGVTSYEYDKNGRRTQTNSGGIVTTYRYDDVGNVVEQSTNTQLDFVYEYNKNNKITSEKRTEKGKTYTSEYAYDKLGQLTAFTQNDKTAEEYRYDAVGNMLQKTIGNTPVEMTYNKVNQLKNMKSVGGSISYAYDQNGNLTKKSLNELVSTYTYDALGNLSSYNGYDGYHEKYEYNAQGMLSTKQQQGKPSLKTMEELIQSEKAIGQELESGETEWQTTEYIYDVTQQYYQVLQETTNKKTTSYDYGVERISAQTSTSKKQYIYDGRGSVAQVISGTGSVQSKRYTPFGEQLSVKTSGYGYNAEYFNANTGTINLRARQYEPAMMRFSQMDILRGKDSDPNSLNRYLYCQNDPVNFVDLDGLQMQFNATAKQIEQWVRKNPTVPLMKSTKETYKKAIKQTQKTGTASAKKWAEGKSEDTLTQIAVESIVAQEDLKRIDAGITNSQDYFAQLLKDVKGNKNVSQSQIDSIMKKAQADINAAGGVKKLSVYTINKIMLAACGGVKGSEEKPHTAIDTIMQNIAQNIINSIPNEIKEDIKNFDMSNQSENKVL
ncbi:MAG: RHS repeat-associated core domain-containing protein, partial [Christensenellaceae bacterium]